MQLCRRSARHRFTQLYDDLQAFYCQIAIVDTLAWVINNAATMLFVAANLSLAFAHSVRSASIGSRREARKAG
jgi:hypothetical protein